MSTALPPRPIYSDWKTLYRAAVLETEKSVIRGRMSAAVSAILARQKELFSSGTSEETEALEEALYLLRAYRNALEHTEPEITGNAAKPAAA